MINRVFGFPLDQGERDLARFLEMPGAPLGDHEDRSGNDLAGPHRRIYLRGFPDLAFRGLLRVQQPRHEFLIALFSGSIDAAFSNCCSASSGLPSTI